MSMEDDLEKVKNLRGVTAEEIEAFMEKHTDLDLQPWQQDVLRTLFPLPPRVQLVGLIGLTVVDAYYDRREHADIIDWDNGFRSTLYRHRVRQSSYLPADGAHTSESGEQP